MRPELRRKVLAKLKQVYAEIVSPLELVITTLTEDQKKSIREDFWRDQRKRADKELSTKPDSEFGTIMDDLDSAPPAMQKLVKESLRYVKKNRGGRPPDFPLEIRRNAIRDIGHEYPQCDSLRQAIELVAIRYGMKPDYLGKVWKNRRRLRTIDSVSVVGTLHESKRK